VKVVAAALAAGLLVAAGAAWLWPESASDVDRYRGSEPPPDIPMPSFALRDAVGGTTVRSSDLRGKVVLVTFLDTQCREACPIIASQVASALRLLDDDERAEVATVAITVNPRVDTPRHVRTFLRTHRASSLIRYLTGSEAQLRPVWKAFHVLPALDTGDDDVHSADVRVFDRDATWVATLHTPVDLTPENLAHDVREALH